MCVRYNGAHRIEPSLLERVCVYRTRPVYFDDVPVGTGVRCHGFPLGLFSRAVLQRGQRSHEEGVLIRLVKGRGVLLKRRVHAS